MFIFFFVSFFFNFFSGFESANGAETSRAELLFLLFSS